MSDSPTIADFIMLSQRPLEAARKLQAFEAGSLATVGLLDLGQHAVVDELAREQALGMAAGEERAIANQLAE